MWIPNFPPTPTMILSKKFTLDEERKIASEKLKKKKENSTLEQFPKCHRWSKKIHWLCMSESVESPNNSIIEDALHLHSDKRVMLVF